MRAAVFEGVGELVVREVDVPDVGAGEVLVKVGANTLCGTDLRIFRGEKTAGVSPPAIIGHEVAGHVVEVGKGVAGFEVGAAVTITPMIPCGQCFYCRRDMENVCENVFAVGYETPGGLAEYMKVPAKAIEMGCLFAVDGDLPLERLALTEPSRAASTGRSGLRSSREMRF